MYRPPKSKYFPLYLLTLVLVVLSVLAIVSLNFRSQEDQEEEVLVCNAADCMWFSSNAISEDISNRCTWTTASYQRPPHWQCGPFIR